MKRMLEVGESTPEFHLIYGEGLSAAPGNMTTAFAELRKARGGKNRILPFVHFNLGIALRGRRAEAAKA